MDNASNFLISEMWQHGEVTKEVNYLKCFTVTALHNKFWDKIPSCPDLFYMLKLIYSDFWNFNCFEAKTLLLQVPSNALQGCLESILFYTLSKHFRVKRHLTNTLVEVVMNKNTLDKWIYSPFSLLTTLSFNSLALIIFLSNIFINFP